MPPSNSKIIWWSIQTDIRLPNMLQLSLRTKVMKKSALSATWPLTNVKHLREMRSLVIAKTPRK